MTVTDSPEAADEAAPATIPISAVSAELAEEAEWHRRRKLMRAAQVDDLLAQVARLTEALEATAPAARTDDATEEVPDDATA